MASLNIMPLMTDSLMADCGYMPNSVFGAYVKILIHWWRVGPSPTKASRLMLVAGCSDDEFDIIRQHLTETPEGFIQKKLWEVWDKQAARSEKAKRSAGKRWGNADDYANAYPNAPPNAYANADANAPPNAMLSVNHDSIPDGIHHRDDAGADVSRETNRGKRLSEDWKPPSEFIAWAVENENLTVEEAFREADQFRDYWIAETGAKSAKRDWFATWRNRVRAVAPRIRKARASGSNGGTGSGYARHADPVEVRNRLLRELAEKEDVSTDGRELRSVAGR